MEVKANIFNNFVYGNTSDPGSSEDAWRYNIYDDKTLDTVGYFDHLEFNNLSFINP